VQNLRIAAGKEVENLAAWLEGSGFENLLEAKVGTLSGGMRRRLEVLRCVVQQPKVLLLDEPFSGVEPLHVEFLKRQIIDLRGKGLGVLLTDHAVRQVLPLCDRALIIDRGTVQCSGSPEVVAADHGVRDRYLGHDFSL
jgi:lipopolysaccharide export system ATP-binding protein